jgi:hypothetical protein
MEKFFRGLVLACPFVRAHGASNLRAGDFRRLPGATYTFSSKPFRNTGLTNLFASGLLVNRIAL